MKNAIKLKEEHFLCIFAACFFSKYRENDFLYNQDRIHINTLIILLKILFLHKAIHNINMNTENLFITYAMRFTYAKFRVKYNIM